MKMINCQLKASKSAMYFFPMNLSSHQFSCYFAAVREAVEANQLLRINFGCQYQLLEDRKYKAQRKYYEKYTAISTNCKSALMKVFRDSTDQHLIQNSLPSQALHGRFIKIRHFVNILYTICMDRYYKPIVLHFF